MKVIHAAALVAALTMGVQAMPPADPLAARSPEVTKAVYAPGTHYHEDQLNGEKRAAAAQEPQPIPPMPPKEKRQEPQPLPPPMPPKDKRAAVAQEPQPLPPPMPPKEKRQEPQPLPPPMPPKEKRQEPQPLPPPMPPKEKRQEPQPLPPPMPPKEKRQEPQPLPPPMPPKLYTVHTNPARRKVAAKNRALASPATNPARQARMPRRRSEKGPNERVLDHDEKERQRQLESDEDSLKSDLEEYEKNKAKYTNPNKGADTEESLASDLEEYNKDMAKYEKDKKEGEAEERAGEDVVWIEQLGDVKPDDDQSWWDWWQDLQRIKRAVGGATAAAKNRALASPPGSGAALVARGRNHHHGGIDSNEPVPDVGGGTHCAAVRPEWDSCETDERKDALDSSGDDLMESTDGWKPTKDSEGYGGYSEVEHRRSKSGDVKAKRGKRIVRLADVDD